MDVHNLVKREDLNTLCLNCFHQANFYDTEVDSKERFSNICDCQILFITRGDTLLSTFLQLISLIVSYGDDVFPK